MKIRSALAVATFLLGRAATDSFAADPVGAD